MTDLDERLQRALRTIAQDVDTPEDLDRIRDSLMTHQAVTTPTTPAPPHQGRYVSAAAALLVIAALGSLLWWYQRTDPAPASPPTWSYRTNDRDLPSNASAYQLPVPGATIAGDEALRPSTTDAAVWQVPDGYLSLVVGLGSTSGRAGLPADEPIPELPGDARWGTNSRADHREIWWERPDGALWIIGLDQPGADTMTDQLVAWAGSITQSPESGAPFHLAQSDVRLIRSDTAGELTATQRRWTVGDHEIVLDITLGADAVGVINQLAYGPAEQTVVMGRHAWRSVDDVGTTRIAWDTTEGSTLR